MTLLMDTPTTALTTPPADVAQWVESWAEIFTPSEVVWCDGSARERHELIELMQQTGTIEPLNPDIRPYSFVARSEPTDVARVESRTFVCSESEDDAGPTNNWMAPEDMRQELLALKAGAMAGRTMYVVPFSMGPIDSPMARYGVQITDSPYVVVSLHLMVRVSNRILQAISSGVNWVKCVHTVGAPLAEGRGRRGLAVQRHQIHFPLPRIQRNLVVWLRLRRQRPAAQESLCAEDCLGHGPG